MCERVSERISMFHREKNKLYVMLNLRRRFLSLQLNEAVEKETRSWVHISSRDASDKTYFSPQNDELVETERWHFFINVPCFHLVSVSEHVEKLWDLVSG